MLHSFSKDSQRGEAHTTSAAGFTLLELMASLSLMFVMSGFAVFSLREMIASTNNASLEVTSFMKQVRAHAVATTSAYRVTPDGANRLQVSSAANCGATVWTAEPRLTLTLRDGANFTNTGWSICFSSRGFAQQGITVGIQDPRGQSASIEVFLGGAVQVS